MGTWITGGLGSAGGTVGLYVEGFSQRNDSVCLLLGKPGPREIRFLEKKLLVKQQMTAGNHLVVVCICFLPSDLRLGIGPGRSGSLSRTGSPRDLG